MKRGLTEQAKQLKNKAPKSVVEQFERQYLHSLSALTTVDHSMAYKTSILFIKEVEHNTSEPISCKAGCGYCCHQPVFVSTAEYDDIKAYLIANNRKIDRATIQAQHDDIDDGIFHKLKVIDRKCVFLGEDNACSIYEARPLMCRRYNVYSDPKFCASGSMNEIKYDVSPRTEGHLSAYFAYYNGDFFPSLLLKTEELFDTPTSAD